MAGTSMAWDHRRWRGGDQGKLREGEATGVLEPKQTVGQVARSPQLCQKEYKPFCHLWLDGRRRATLVEMELSYQEDNHLDDPMTLAPSPVVHFRALEKPKEDDFCLELSKLHTYDDVVEQVAHQLNVDDPSKIRLTSHNCYSQQPKPQPIKYRGVDHLSDMPVHYNQTSDILYYEVLDIPLPELQGLKTLKVAFHHATKDEVSIHTIRLPKQSTVGDVIDELKTKVELSNPNAELRLLEVFYHKIYKWKIAFLSLGRPEYLHDTNMVSSRFQKRCYGAWEQYLGLEHSDNAPKRAYAASQVRSVGSFFIPLSEWRHHAINFCLYILQDFFALLLLVYLRSDQEEATSTCVVVKKHSGVAAGKLQEGSCSRVVGAEMSSSARKM
ncbi:hypothetical protein TEA_020734 [Camellia sinensis var. sinensis]|uniref:ubiquitinyl hydrolase 1 n=1 Tax=Camellia sinensis var. sinensis TaxID=542762 RepID=A0A4S4E7I6_CAMSN|nr:hypothetical protein TEA_020734 [Camellia sinensis var. sinensis]